MDRQQLVIVGAGPAGLSAGIYTARAGIRTLVLGCDPKIAGNYEIDNYFGFEETISGRELMERGKKQAERFGAEVRCERVLGIHMTDDGQSYHVKTENTELETCAVILATGVGRVRPGIKNVDDYEGKGVSYCVSCDGFFYKGRKVVVTGEGIFAANQALELTNYTRDVRIVTQGKKSKMTPEFLERLDAAGIKVIEDRIVNLGGNGVLENALLESGGTMDVDGLFVAMGEASSLDFAFSLGLERKGVFLQADPEQQTNLPGVFAAGDCLGGFLQISVAVGEGAKAARSAINYIKEKCNGLKK